MEIARKANPVYFRNGPTLELSAAEMSASMLLFPMVSPQGLDERLDGVLANGDRACLQCGDQVAALDGFLGVGIAVQPDAEDVGAAGLQASLGGVRRHLVGQAAEHVDLGMRL